MSKKKTEYDAHIVEALKKLPVPMSNFHGAHIYFDRDKRDESIYEHIAKKCHRLTLKDILVVPSVLLRKDALKTDRNGKKFRSYVGVRTKKNEKMKYVKIVTRLGKNGDEYIVTIYLIKKRYC